MTIAELLALIVLASWLFLLVGWGRFWLASVRDDDGASQEPALPQPAVPQSALAQTAPMHSAQSQSTWPTVTVVIPARNEAECIGDTIRSLLAQDYPRDFQIILVDDQSSDGTANVAYRAAEAMRATYRLMLVSGKPLPDDWNGKPWAMKQGIDRAAALSPAYFLLTDADIVYAPGVLAWLVRQAETRQLGLVSLFAKLRCEDLPERAFIPAFCFFFQMIYPFAWVNDPRRAIAGAAGGCMLVRRNVLQMAGGIESIRNVLIDDCALAKRVKPHAPIWLGLTDRVRSIRKYPKVADIWRMVSRTAYEQLRYSEVRLAGTITGMMLMYLTPVYFTLFGPGTARYLGLAAWLMMAVAFLPTLRFYRMSPSWAPLLPAIAIGYMVFTIDSAIQHWRGRGGLWKGRVSGKA
jgi:hopene-associated glycosyltransferase HpnB